MRGAVFALAWMCWATLVCAGAAVIMTSIPGSENNLPLILATTAVAAVLVWGGFALMIRALDRW